MDDKMNDNGKIDKIEDDFDKIWYNERHTKRL